MIALTAIAVLGLTGAGFTDVPAEASAKTGPAPATTPFLAPTTLTAPNSIANLAFINYYYWYDEIDGGILNDYEPLDYEIYEEEIYWGVQVDQNPLGGILLEEGFWFKNPNYPPMYFLYGHFD